MSSWVTSKLYLDDNWPPRKWHRDRVNYPVHKRHRCQSRIGIRRHGTIPKLVNLFFSHHAVESEHSFVRFILSNEFGQSVSHTEWGAYTFKYKQSSLPTTSESLRKGSRWIHMSEPLVASKTPSHCLAGNGFYIHARAKGTKNRHYSSAHDIESNKKNPNFVTSEFSQIFWSTANHKMNIIHINGL